MCEPASFVLTKQRVFWSMVTDSHTGIINEHGLNEDSTHGVNVLKVEIVPPDGDFAADLSEWVYRIDQDILPKWHDAKSDERRARRALGDWVSARVVTGDLDELSHPGTYFVTGSANIKRVTGSANIKWVTGSANIEWVTGSANIEWVAGLANIKWVTGSANIEWVAGLANIKRVTGLANIEWVAGSANIEWVDGSANIKGVDGSANIKRVDGHSTVRRYGAKASVAEPCHPMAVVIDCTGQIASCSVGKLDEV